MIEVYAKDYSTIPIGKKGEDRTRVIIFDLRSWVEELGEGDILLLAQRNGESAPYPCTVTFEDGIARWTVRAADVDKPGVCGTAELIYTVDGHVAKSEAFSTFVAPALGGAIPEAPSPEADWVQNVLNVSEDVRRAADLVVDAPENARIATEGAERAEAARIGAEEARDAAKAAQTGAETARAGAEEAQAGAEAAKNAAEAAQNAAETAQDGAETAKAGAEVAQAGAEAAKNAAEAAQNAAETAKTGAESAQAGAETAKSDAENSALSAAQSADTAMQYSGNPAIPVDETWRIWNAESGQYEDSGQPSRGPVGPVGPPGAIVEANGLYGFYVEEAGNLAGHLILSYSGDEAPNFSIDRETGHLIYNY